MSHRKSLDAAKKAVRRAGAQTAPSAEVFVPEIRSNIKWKPSGLPVQAFRPEARIMLVWSFGVPFAQLDGLHDWLATNEVTLANECHAASQGEAAYLGTYLHIDTGSPRYQTLWGLKSEEASEAALKAALENRRLFFDLVKVLRGYWSRDGNATDHRYGLARHYINLDGLPVDSAFWTVTRHSRTEQPL
jgi:hypothetical protein